MRRDFCRSTQIVGGVQLDHLVASQVDSSKTSSEARMYCGSGRAQGCIGVPMDLADVTSSFSCPFVLHPLCMSGLRRVPWAGLRLLLHADQNEGSGPVQQDLTLISYVAWGYRTSAQPKLWRTDSRWPERQDPLKASSGCLPPKEDATGQTSPMLVQPLLCLTPLRVPSEYHAWVPINIQTDHFCNR